MTFATGGLAYWFPTFLFRMRGWHLTSATQFFGAITVIAGIAGTLFGGFIADLWQHKNRKSYFYVSALGMLVAAPCAVGAILIQNRAWVFPLVFLAEFFLFFNMGPLNAAIISVVHPKMRATAMALNILFIHLLGDAVSTWVIGKVSDMTQSLTAGLLIGPVAILLGGIILMSGANRLAEDQLKLDAELKKI
jgi:sugar phosphate permease